MSDVDLRCAVNLAALPMRSLPLRGVVLAGEDSMRDKRGHVRSRVTMPGYRKSVPNPNRGLRFPPEPLTVEEVLRLLDVCPLNPIGIRNRALFVVLWRSGLRISEALALEPRDLNEHAGTIHVRHGKGDKARFSGMDPAAFDELQAWLSLRARYPAGPLFCVIEGPSRGGLMRSAYVRVVLKEYATRAGIEKRVHPHGFRHTLAMEIAEEMPMHYVQRQLGHTSLATTANYLSGLAPIEVWKAMGARPWPGEGHS